MVGKNHLKLVNLNGWKSFQQDSLRPLRAENMRGNVKDFSQEQAGNNAEHEIIELSIFWNYS